jgi:elongation factor 1-beta
MKFEGLDTPKGLGELNKHLQDRSYIEGYTPSQADVEVFGAITSAPDATKNPHAARWYSHISSFSEDERKRFVWN